MTSMAPSRGERSSAEIATEGDARDALDLVSRICRDVGPGVPGSHQERHMRQSWRRTWERLGRLEERDRAGKRARRG